MPAMLPQSLALIDHDEAARQPLARHLRERGVDVREFSEAPPFLAHPDAFEQAFYVVDLMLPGFDGIELIKLLRLRSPAGLVVVASQLTPDAFCTVLRAGADMVLAKPIADELLAAAIEAVQRRCSRTASAEAAWRFDRRTRVLIAPDGGRVALSDTDITVLNCFVETPGEPVSREALRVALGYAPDAGTESALNAAIFRLRRRIERATSIPVPLQAKSRVGYQFRARIEPV